VKIALMKWISYMKSEISWTAREMGRVPECAPSRTAREMGRVPKKHSTGRAVKVRENCDCALVSVFGERLDEFATLNPVDDEEIDDEDHLFILKNRKVFPSSMLFMSDRPEDEVEFIFDSGGSRHMCPNIDYFDFLVKDYGDISLGNGSIIHSYGVGNVGMLKDVLYVPNLVVGLISVSELDEDGMSTTISGGKLVVNDNNGDVFLTGTKKRKLYYLDSERIVDETELAFIAEGSAPKRWKSQRLGGSELELLHHGVYIVAGYFRNATNISRYVGIVENFSVFIVLCYRLYGGSIQRVV
jgi:hypothetical protein